MLLKIHFIKGLLMFLTQLTKPRLSFARFRTYEPSSLLFLVFLTRILWLLKSLRRMLWRREIENSCQKLIYRTACSKSLLSRLIYSAKLHRSFGRKMEWCYSTENWTGRKNPGSKGWNFNCLLQFSDVNHQTLWKSKLL